MSHSQPTTEELEAEVLQSIDARFSSWEDLVAYANEGSSGAGDGSMQTVLDQEIESWEQVEADSSRKLQEIESQLPTLLKQSIHTLTTLQQTATSLSLSSYPLSGPLEPYISDLDIFQDQTSTLSDHKMPGEDAPIEERGFDILGRLEELKDRLEGLQKGRRWLEELETVMSLTQTALSALSSTTSSPLKAFPQFKSLYSFIASLQPGSPAYFPHSHDPAGDRLLAIAETAQAEVWEELRSRLAGNLEKALEGLGWPKKFDYPTLSIDQRRAFEAAFRELLVLQAEAEKLGMDTSKAGQEGLYAFRTLIQSVALRFSFHFEGTRGTNRLDKPEWAFTNILDFLYDQGGFAEEYLQGLLDRNGYKDIDAQSELAAQVISLPLALLHARLPHLLPHPALLAHTVYQTVIFDDAILAGGFRIGRTFARRPRKNVQYGKGEREEWKGLAREFLESKGCFEGWLAGEKSFAEDQFNDIISSPDAWTIVDEEMSNEDDEEGLKSDLKPTNGARQVQALIEQVTDRYSSLPNVTFKLPFLTTIQISLLISYHARITSSLEAFENLSSSFARAVPGALAGHAGRDGLSLENGKMTSGSGGLQRLIKAWVGAAWLQEVLERWGDELVFVQLLADAQGDAVARAEFEENDALPSLSTRNGEPPSSVFDVILARYTALVSRAEDMVTRHVCVEVERDLKQHLTRRWDTPSNGSDALDWSPGPDLFTPLTTLTSHLGHLAQSLPTSVLTRLYRAIVAHISNHILQRAVYAGWSKYTEVGGQELLAEVEAWSEASQMGLNRAGGVRKPEAPWRQLRESARILALRTELSDGELSFSQAMALAFGDGWGFLKEKLDFKELSQDQVQGVMRRRIECYR